MLLTKKIWPKGLDAIPMIVTLYKTHLGGLGRESHYWLNAVNGYVGEGHGARDCRDLWDPRQLPALSQDKALSHTVTKKWGEFCSHLNTLGNRLFPDQTFR